MKRFFLSRNVMILATVTLFSQTTFAVLPAVDVTNSSASASTSNTSQLQTRLTAGIVSVDAQGKEMLAPLNAQTQLTSGNVVEYHGYVINNSPDRVRKMKVTFAIPANMELVPDSVTPALAFGSNDGQTFNYMPIRTSVNGVVQDMPMAYYKFLQWDVVGLGMNDVAEVKYRAKVK